MSKRNKFILWCAIIAVASFWMWAAARIWLSGSLLDQANLDSFGVFGAILIFLISFLSIGFIVFSGKKEGIILSSIVGLTYFMFFGISNFNLLGVTILILLFIHADDVVSNEILERTKINSRKLIRRSSNNIVLGLFILISFAAYGSPAIESFKNINELPSSSEVFIKTVVNQTLSGELEGATPQQKDAVLNEVTRRMVERGNLFLKPYFEYIPPALAFGLFLALWGVGWIFIWLSVFLGMLIFWMLKRFKYFRIEERDMKAEVLLI